MAYRTPPIITPVALVSIILALSAANAIVNVSTGKQWWLKESVIIVD